MLAIILPISLATILNIVIGMLWYSPLLFGKIWAKEKNIDMNKAEGQTRGMIISFIVGILQASALLVFMKMPRVITIFNALFVCILLWGGFMLTTQLIDLAWGGKKFKVFLIDSFHQLTSLIITGTLIFLLK